jgi:hypothetical protein
VQWDTLRHLGRHPDASLHDLDQVLEPPAEPA